MIKINLMVDPAFGRMSILKEQGKDLKVYTYSGSYKTDLFMRYVRIVKYLQNIIDDTRRGKDKNEKIEIELYMEKPRIAQNWQGRTVEKGFAYRLHWVISSIITTLSIMKNVDIKKISLIGVNKWYYALNLNKGGRKMRKQNALDFAEDIVKEYNIKLKTLKEDEADVIGIWYYVSQIAEYEIIGATDNKTAAMNIHDKVKRAQDIKDKEQVLKWFKEHN